MGNLKEYPLGFVIDLDTNLIIPGIGGGTDEPGADGGGAQDASADLGGGEGLDGGTGEETPPGDNGAADGSQAQQEFLTPEEKELLGGRNFKSKGDLIRSLLNAGAHIERLQEERRQDRAAFSDLSQRLQALESGGGRPAQPTPSVSPDFGKDDPQYIALWNAQKFQEANAYLARKVAEHAINEALAKTRNESEGQVADLRQRQRYNEAKAAVDRMLADTTKYPGFQTLLPRIHAFMESKGRKWMDAYESAGDMFHDAYAIVAPRFPNLVNSGKGRAASAIGGGTGAGAKTRPGQEAARKPLPKVDAKTWDLLGLEPNPYDGEESVLEAKYREEEAKRLAQRKAAASGI
jgi:hypothetical protein